MRTITFQSRTALYAGCFRLYHALEIPVSPFQIDQRSHRNLHKVEGFESFLVGVHRSGNFFYVDPTPGGPPNEFDIYYMITHVHVHTSHLYRDRRWRVIARVKGQIQPPCPAACVVCNACWSEQLVTHYLIRVLGALYSGLDMGRQCLRAHFPDGAPDSLLNTLSGMFNQRVSKSGYALKMLQASCFS